MENQWLHRCSRPHIQMFHTSAPGVKVVEFPVLNCAALCPQTDGSSFAEKGQSVSVVPAHHLLDLEAWVHCLLQFKFCRKREHLEALVSLCKDCPELRTGLQLQLKEGEVSPNDFALALN